MRRRYVATDNLINLIITSRPTVEAIERLGHPDVLMVCAALLARWAVEDERGELPWGPH